MSGGSKGTSPTQLEGTQREISTLLPSRRENKK